MIGDRLMGFGERRSACYHLRVAAEVRYSMEKLGLEDGDPSPPGLLYEEERDLFRFPGGRFAFSERYIDVDALVRRSMREGPTPKELARMFDRTPESNSPNLAAPSLKKGDRGSAGTS